MLEEEDYEKEKFYENSILNCANLKKPDELIDKDLLNLLSFIKRLPETPTEFLKSKTIELGDLTRHRTLIWDLDETLVHA